ncbi:cilia- and flagella-associated protein 97-like [Montipora capricornis]|uniref:cilia- and flagella-associated protein 97-like n=1 Tax=Montipora foliosa TaxID=591990 RepID=UPI0035F17E61
MAAVRRHRRRGSTGTTSNDNTEDRLKREHFLHPNSDQIDLNRLLQAVLDINEKLNERQPQESVDEIRGGTSAEDQWDDIKEKQDIDDTASRHSVASSSRSRPRSGLINAESRRPTPLERKNMSFSNAKVDAIDRENQRLLREITRTRGRPKSAQKSKLVSEPLRVQTSSEVNRCRFQRKVDMDNQKFLQRLEAVRPTRGLSRDSLLKEHIKQKQYSKTASRSRPSSAKSTTSSVLSRTPSESSLMIGDSVSVASSRLSHGSQRLSKKRTSSKPVWEAGW